MIISQCAHTAGGTPDIVPRNPWGSAERALGIADIGNGIRDFRIFKNT